MEQAKKNWDKYVNAWSETDREKRNAIFDDIINESSTYTDPLTEQPLAGHDALHAYIEQSQEMFPGVHFKIKQVIFHHGKSLAHWDMCDGNENVIAPGNSYIEYDDNGKLTREVGFFEMSQE